MHGYTPVDLLQSSIISIPNDLKASLCNSKNYRGISLFDAIYKVYGYDIIYLCIIFLTPLICNLDLSQSIEPSYVALFTCIKN